MEALPTIRRLWIQLSPEPFEIEPLSKASLAPSPDGLEPDGNAIIGDCSGPAKPAGNPVWHLVDGYEDDAPNDSRRVMTRCGIEHIQSINADSNKPWRMTEMHTDPGCCICPSCQPKARKARLKSA